jgi:hypothetical protein
MSTLKDNRRGSQSEFSLGLIPDPGLRLDRFLMPVFEEEI